MTTALQLTAPDEPTPCTCTGPEPCAACWRWYVADMADLAVNEDRICECCGGDRECCGCEVETAGGYVAPLWDVAPTYYEFQEGAVCRKHGHAMERR